MTGEGASDPPRRVAAAALWALFAFVLLWHGWLAPPHSAPPALIAALSALPLVPVLLLWWRKPRLGLIFGALIGLGYFAHGLTEALVEPDARWLGTIEVALVVVLIGALGAATGHERRARRGTR